MEENNVATLTSLIGHICNQVQCREGTLEERKESENIWQLEPAAAKLIGKTSTFQLTRYINVSEISTITTQKIADEQFDTKKKVKLAAERICFRYRRANHYARFFKTSITCKIFKERHATSVCRSREEAKNWTVMTTENDEQSESERQTVLNTQRMKSQNMETGVILLPARV